MSRVILFEKPRQNIDISHAESFGEVHYLFSDERRRCSAFNTDLFQATILKELDRMRYDPEEDYICIAGSMIVIAIGVVAVAKGYGDFKVLLFSSTENSYVERMFREDVYHAAK